MVDFLEERAVEQSWEGRKGAILGKGESCVCLLGGDQVERQQPGRRRGWVR